jgi:hypothetical protein
MDLRAIRLAICRRKTAITTAEYILATLPIHWMKPCGPSFEPDSPLMKQRFVS